MSYHIIYEPDHLRIMPACIMDARADIPEIKNQIGSVIQSYIDSQIALVKSNTFFYKIETELGVLVGYFVVEVNDVTFLFFTIKQPRLLTKRLRPAFKQFGVPIDLEISTFIQQSDIDGELVVASQPGQQSVGDVALEGVVAATPSQPGGLTPPITAKEEIEIANAFALISPSTDKRLIYVKADETNNNNRTMYLYTGTELIFLQIVL